MIEIFEVPVTPMMRLLEMLDYRHHGQNHFMGHFVSRAASGDPIDCEEELDELAEHAMAFAGLLN